MKQYSIAELLGDGISAELSESVHRIAKSLPFTVEFHAVDLSLAARQRDKEGTYRSVQAAMVEYGTSLKYPTTTKDESPNKVLREYCKFDVIHRPVSTFDGVENNFKRRLDVDVVRIATGGTYADPGQRNGEDSATSCRLIERIPTRNAARYAFRLAKLKGSDVVSTSKWTIQKATDGLFEEECANVARQFNGVPHRKELFDSLLAGVIMNPDRYNVLVTPNEYGDFLSDMCCGLVGSIGLGDSASYAFDDQGEVSLAMFDPAGGTAPDIAGKGICNPSAALLAFGSLLNHLGERECGEGLRQAVRDAIAAGDKTGDIGGKLNCAEFTDAVAVRLQRSLQPANS